MPAKLSIEDLTSSLAVGSLIFLGLFLTVDRFLDLWSFIESYASDATWAIVAAIPTLVITYAIGLFAISATDIIFLRLRGKKLPSEVEKYITIAELKNDVIAQRYITLKRNQAFFQGCTAAFFILTIGALCSTKWMPGYEIFSYITAAGCLLVCILCPFFAVRISSEADLFVNHKYKPEPEAQEQSK